MAVAVALLIQLLAITTTRPAGAIPGPWPYGQRPFLVSPPRDREQLARKAAGVGESAAGPTGLMQAKSMDGNNPYWPRWKTFKESLKGMTLVNSKQLNDIGSNKNNFQYILVWDRNKTTKGSIVCWMIMQVSWGNGHFGGLSFLRDITKNIVFRPNEISIKCAQKKNIGKQQRFSKYKNQQLFRKFYNEDSEVIEHHSKYIFVGSQWTNKLSKIEYKKQKIEYDDGVDGLKSFLNNHSEILLEKFVNKMKPKERLEKVATYTTAGKINEAMNCNLGECNTCGSIHDTSGMVYAYREAFKKKYTRYPDDDSETKYEERVKEECIECGGEWDQDGWKHAK